VGPRAGVDVLKKRKMCFFFLQNGGPRFLSSNFLVFESNV